MLPNGDTFDGASRFQQLIAGRGEELTRCLTEKLLTYALGREIEFGDRPNVDRISKELADNDKGLRDLIQAVIASESFQRN